MITLDQATVDRVEEELRDDVAWAVAGDMFDPEHGAIFIDGTWVSTMYGTVRDCPVCAIGAACVRRQPSSSKSWNKGYYDDVATVADLFKVPYEWMLSVYFAVTDFYDDLDLYKEDHDRSPQAWDLGRRLRAYADTLMEA